MSKDTFKQKYNQLNISQKQAVDTIEGPVMVVAGPGTGKTTLLTLRIANILKQTDVQPENILALTFTNSGVRAMRNKLIELIGDEAYRVGIYTFHSFAEYVMKEFSIYFPQFTYAHVITDLERIQILENILTDPKFKELVSLHDPFMSLKQVVGSINDIKKEGIDVEEFAKRIPQWEKDLLSDDSIFYKRKFGKFKAGDMKPSEKEKIDKKVLKAKEISEIYSLYQTELQNRHLYDFSDMILTILNELEKNENLKLDLQEQYQYLLVDEHQDTNEGQNKLIEYLTDAEHLDGRANIFTVGDEKQSIYRFQGASEETFKHLQSLYNDSAIITLTDNYRSTQEILDGSHHLIEHTDQKVAKLKAKNGSGILPTDLNFSNYKFELLYIADDIKQKLESGVDPNEIALIYRSNRHIEDIKEVLGSQSIPFTIRSKDTIFNDPNIEHLISLLHVVDRFKDSHNLGKLLFADFLQIDPHDVVRVLDGFNKLSRENKTTLFNILSDETILQNVGVIDSIPFIDLSKKIKELKILSENTPFPTFFKELLEVSGYLKHILASNDSQGKLLKIDTLFDEIKRQSQNIKQYKLLNFLSFVDAYKKYDLDIETYEPEYLEGVQCMTAHKSKGLEFEHVYIVNTLRNNWEKNHGFPKISIPIDDYKGTLDDERRLFYVAMTRAKKSLTITSSKTDWEGREKEKSQFISEIGELNIKTETMSDFEKNNIDRLSTFMKHTPDGISVWDTEYITKLFLNSNLSVTALNNYIECPVMYLLRSLIKLPSEYSPALLFGDSIHTSLEKFFKESQIAEKILEYKILETAFQNIMNTSSFYGKEYDKYLKRGLEILKDYYDEYHTGWTTQISNEKRITREFMLDDGRVLNLSGILDKVEYLDSELGGPIRIVDYKTGKPYSDKTQKSQKEALVRQIIFYHLLLEGFNDNKYTIDTAVLDFMEKNKKGKFEQHTVPVSDDDIAEMKELINEMSKDIMSGDFLKKGCQKKDCEYCQLYGSIKN